MRNDTTTPLQIPEASTKDVLTEILRDGAREMLGKAIEAEVTDYIAAHDHERDADGHRLVVRNGHTSSRDLQTGLGAITVKQPRVNDKRTDEDGHRIRFTSHILPPYPRKTKSIEELIPWLSLRGISSGDFSRALAALLENRGPKTGKTGDGKQGKTGENRGKTGDSHLFIGVREGGNGIRLAYHGGRPNAGAGLRL